MGVPRSEVLISNLPRWSGIRNCLIGNRLVTGEMADVAAIELALRNRPRGFTLVGTNALTGVDGQGYANCGIKPKDNNDMRSTLFICLVP